MPFIISATKSDDTFDNLYSNSNFGARVDLSAPGGLIYSTVPIGSNPTPDPTYGTFDSNYGTKSGTSMAAPMVSGAGAAVMSMNPNLIMDYDTKDILIRMATDLGAPGRDAQFGWGRLFLSAPMMQALRSADTFVSSEPYLIFEFGTYGTPWRSIPNALASVPDRAVLVLNGGHVLVPTYHYPAITITKPCTLTALPDRPVVIGQ